MLRKYRNLLIFLGIVLALSLSLVALAPFAIRAAAITWLTSDDGRVARISDVDFNPLTGRLIIKGLEVTSPDGRQSTADRIAGRIKLAELWKKRVHLQTLEIQNSQVEAERDSDDVLRVAGFSPQAARGQSGAFSGWQIGAEFIAVYSLRTALVSVDAPESITIEHFRASDLAMWLPDRTSSFDTAISLGAGSLHIMGEMQPFATAPTFEFKATTSAIDLAKAAKFNPQPRSVELTGILTSNVIGKLVLSSVGNTSLSLTGSATVDKISASPNQHTAESANLAVGITIEQAVIEDMDLSLSVGSHSEQNLMLDADTSLHDLKVQGVVFALQEKHLGWNGVIEASANDGEVSNLFFHGELNGEAVKFGQGEGNTEPVRSLTLDHFTIRNLDGQIGIRPDNTIGVDVSTAIELRGIHGAFGESSFSNSAIDWDGKIEVSTGTADTPSVQADGEFRSEQLDVILPDAGLRLSQDVALWSGKVGYRPGLPPKNRFTVNAGAQTKGTRIDSTELGIRLLDLSTLEVKGIELAGYGQIGISRLTAMGLQTVQQMEGAPGTPKSQAYLASAGTLIVKDLNMLDRKRIKAGAVTLSGIDVAVERLADGELHLVGTLLGLAGRITKTSGPDSEKDDDAFALMIDRWIVAENSRLTFTDHTVNPAAKFALAPIEIQILNIDTRKPLSRSPIKLSAKLGNSAGFDFNGTISPFSDRLDIDGTGRLSGLELTSFSGYAERHLGLNITQGSLDADVQASIVRGRIKAGSKLTINRLKVEATDPIRSKLIEKRMQLPLGTALSLLRDSEDVIHLDVPISGLVGSPEFDFSDAVNQAVANAMKKTVLATVKLAFPLGGIIMTMVEAGGANKLRFDPVNYVAGDSELNINGRTQIDGIAKLLIERPHIKLSICGWATENDRSVLLERERVNSSAGPTGSKIAINDESLLVLAKRRSETIKEYLSGGLGVSAARIATCEPKLSTDPNASPRVEILL